nr:MAG: DNA pilot protein [Microvirus sp.]
MGSLFDGFSSLASGIGDLTQAGLGVANYFQQQKNYDYMKDMQRQSWLREDNSMQRRVADLTAAGLSPVLAAGNGASSSAPIRLEAPQVDTTVATKGFSGMSDAARTYLDLTSQKAQIDKTNEENKAIRAQRNKTEMETAFLSSANPLNLQGLQQSVEFDKAANPTRLQKLDAENKSIGFSNVNAQLDTKLKNIGIDQAQVDLVNKKLDSQAKSLGLTQQSKDILAKQLAIEMAQVSLDNAKYDTTFYHKKGLPTNFNLGGGMFNAAAGLGAMTGNLFNK